MAAQPDNWVARVTFLGVAQPAKIRGTATPGANLSIESIDPESKGIVGFLPEVPDG
jgi:hypothetical protein